MIEEDKVVLVGHVPETDEATSTAAFISPGSYTDHSSSSLGEGGLPAEFATIFNRDVRSSGRDWRSFRLKSSVGILGRVSEDVAGSIGHWYSLVDSWPTVRSAQVYLELGSREPRLRRRFYVNAGAWVATGKFRHNEESQIFVFDTAYIFPVEDTRAMPLQ